MFIAMSQPPLMHSLSASRSGEPDRNLHRYALVTCWSLAITIAFAPLASQAMDATNLRSEYLIDPLGLDTPRPRLSWVVESATRGDRQTSWQILVASTAEGLAADKGDLWDSGEIKGDETNEIAYDGQRLESRSACFWKVRTWDKDAKVSAWSVPAKWTVGFSKRQTGRRNGLTGIFPAARPIQRTCRRFSQPATRE